MAGGKAAGFAARLLTGALLFVLLAEWLRPLSDMGDITGIVRVEPLIMVLAGLIGVDVLRLPGAAGWTFKTLIILSLPAIYRGVTLFDGGWWSELVRILAEDAGDLLRLRWHLVSPELRTLLFVYAWAVLSSLLFSAVVLRRFALWFTGATLVYLLAADWWTGRDAFDAALRVALAGLLLHALHVPSVMQRRFGAPRLAGGRPAHWMPLSLALAAAVVGGSALAADWAEPRMDGAFDMPAVFSSWSWSGWDGFPAVVPAAVTVSSPSGYGGDDGRLGNPLQPDHAPAFLAVTSRGGRYWRGEAKLVYTGRGWEKGGDSVSDPPAGGTAGGPANAVPPSSQASDGPSAEWHLVYWLDDSLRRMERWPLFASGEPEDVVLFGGPSAAADRPAWETEAGTGDVHLVRPPASAAGFFVRHASGGRPADDRRLANIKPPANDAPPADDEPPAEIGWSADAGWPGDVRALPAGDWSAYLQLPESLPDRVRELARRITDSHPHPRDKALAVERFLKETYTYSLKTAPPEDGRDFVDHFLFEAGSGYCDHFSTAMTVLLRAAGIPARWVKGFMPGEPVPESQALALLEEAGLDAGVVRGLAKEEPAFVLVRNSDAHSWVEAWVPDAGWVTFEPTPGQAGGAGSGEAAAIVAMAPVRGLAENATGYAARLFRQASAVLGGWAEAAAGAADHAARVAAGGAAAAVPVSVFLLRLARRRGIRPDRGTKKAAAGSRFAVAVRLGLYRLGPGRFADDAALLDRMLKCRLAPYLTDRGDTLREAAERAARTAEPVAADALRRAVRLHERALFGPGRGERVPYAELVRLWRAMGKDG